MKIFAKIVPGAGRLGIEYSGIAARGKNVMGIVPCQGLSTHIEGFSHLRWEVSNSNLFLNYQKMDK